MTPLRNISIIMTITIRRTTDANIDESQLPDQTFMAKELIAQREYMICAAKYWNEYKDKLRDRYYYRRNGKNTIKRFIK